MSERLVAVLKASVLHRIYNIRLFIKINIVPLKLSPSHVWYVHQISLQFYHYFLSATKTRSPQCFLNSIEQKEMTESQINGPVAIG